MLSEMRASPFPIQLKEKKKIIMSKKDSQNFAPSLPCSLTTIKVIVSLITINIVLFTHMLEEP